MTQISHLADEIRQTRPFPSPEQETMVALLRTADVLERRLGGVTGCEELSTQQYNVLRILRGSSDDGLPTLEIAARMIARAPGVTRLLDRLEAKALVRRERCLRDRRQVLCRITPEGLGLLAGLDAPIAAVGGTIGESLSPAETRTLNRLLERVRCALGT